MFYLKVTLLGEGKIIGPFHNEEEKERTIENLKRTANSVVCSNNQTLATNGLQMTNISSQRKLDTVSKTDLMYFLTHLVHLDVFNLAA